MTTTMFLMLLSTFSVLSALITEGIKKISNDKANFSWNITATIIALIVGGCGCLVYYKLSEICFTVNNLIYAILMGLSSGLVSMVGYDKVKQAILQLTGKIE